MTDIEEQKYLEDKQRREELINFSIFIPFTNENKANKSKSVTETKGFYNNHFNEYLKYSVLPFKEYIAAEYWFNEAGFQFKWRNHNMIIQLECL